MELSDQGGRRQGEDILHKINSEDLSEKIFK